MWALKFSPDGEYLASASADGVICVWKVRTGTLGRDSRSDLMHVFDEAPVRKYAGHTVSCLAAICFLVAHRGFGVVEKRVSSLRVAGLHGSLVAHPRSLLPLRVPAQARLLLLSLTRRDMVTSVDFFPEEESYFLSGSMDRKLRIWSIPQGCVLKWVQAPAVISTVTFCPGGRLCAAGLLDGQVIFYYSDGLRYFTQTECRNHRGKDKRGRKVTGIAFVERNEGQCMVVTTNDSRIRLISMDTFGLISKYKGHANRSRQFRASIRSRCREGVRNSSNEKYIVCGSDDDRM